MRFTLASFGSNGHWEMNSKNELVFLKSPEVHPKVVVWMTSFLMSRSLIVKLESSLSDAVSVSSGGTQGSLIGALLLLDIINSFQSQES